MDTPHVWSPARPIASLGNCSYDLHLDGKRLALALGDQSTAVQDKVVVLHVFDYLRQIAPGLK